MITKGSGIATYESGIAKQSSFFTGGMDFQALNLDPLITGYAFIIWTHVPDWVTGAYSDFIPMTQKNFKSFDGVEDMSMDTAAYSQSFNGTEYNVASSISKANTEFTLKHQEFSGSPIKDMYQYWISGIRDPETGIATYPVKKGIEYAAKNHTGSLIYIVTRPDANNVSKSNIEFAAYYTNVMPTKIPLSHFNYSQNDHALVEIDIPFKGNMHISPRVDAFAKTQLNKAYSFTTEDMFVPNVGGEGEDEEIFGENITDYGWDTGLNSSNASKA